MKAVGWGGLFCLVSAVWMQALAETSPLWPRQDGVVTVIWQQPERYHDVQASSEQQQRYQQHVFATLGLHLQQQIQPLLTADQRLTVTVHDLDLAGEVRPAIGQAMAPIRVIRDVSPPKISFRYQLQNAQGEVQLTKTIQLIDVNFRYGSTHFLNAPLAYETRMLERWVHQQLQQQISRTLAAYDGQD